MYFTSTISLRNFFQKLSQLFAVMTAFVLPLSTAALEIFFITSIVCAIGAGSWNEKYLILRTNRIALFFLIFFSLFLVGLSYTIAPLPNAFHTVIKYSKFLFGFFLFSIFTDEKTARYAMLAFLSSITLTLLLSYYKFLGDYDFLHRFGNDSGVFKDHIFTGFIVAFASYCYGLIAILSKKWRLVATLFFLLASYNVFFINMGRSGYLVFISLFLLLAWQCARWKGFSMALLISMVLLGGSLIFSSNFKDRFFNVQREVQQYDKGKIDTSIGLRLSFYKNSMKLLRQHPWLGNGTGSFPQAYVNLEKDPRDFTTNPHNEYLNIAVQFGLLGIIILFSLFCIHWIESFRLVQIRQYFAQAVLLSIAVGSLFNSWLMDVTQGCFYVFFTALVFSKSSSTLSDSIKSSVTKF